MTAQRRDSRVAAVVSATAFATAMVVLHLLGRGLLAAPPIGSIPAVVGWLGEREAPVVALVFVRLVALALGYHLVATTLLAVVGRAVHAPRLVAFADAVTLPMFRTIAGRVAGLAISASAVVGGALPTAGAAPAAVESSVGLAGVGLADGPLIERVSLLPGTTADGSTATIRVLPAEPAADPGVVPPAAPAPVLHRVERGDHLWKIAEDALGSALGRPATDAEVDPFWRQVIAANPEIDDPDLIFPGQLVVVPPVPRQSD